MSLEPFDDDRRLIDGFLMGEPAAVRRVDGWINTVLFSGFRALQAEWEDMRQEIRVRVLRNLAQGRFDSRSSLRTYVHRIARNTSIDFSRRAYRRREDGLGQAGALAAAESPARAAPLIARDLLEKILTQLTEEDRALVRLVFAENYSYQEVARELGIPEGTVKSRMARCKERILHMRRELLGH